MGVSKSSAPLIARLDADDVMTPERLEKQLREMVSGPNLVCLGSQIAFIDVEDKMIGASKFPNSTKQVRLALPATNCIAHPSVILRKSAVEKVGGYLENLDGVEDYHLWLKLLQVGDVANHPERLTLYRLHPNQMSRRNEEINGHLESLARIDVFSSTKPLAQGPWAGQLNAMTKTQRDETIGMLEDNLPQKTRTFLKANRNLSFFLRSTSPSKINPLLAALLCAPARTLSLVSMLFVQTRIIPAAKERFSLRNEKKTKSIIIEIVGGIGNQLFAFMAGSYLSQVSGFPFRVFLRNKRPGESVHPSSIASLDIRMSLETQAPLLERIQLVIRRQLRNFALMLGVSEEQSDRISRVHVSSSDGRDPKLLSCSGGYYISGYFQTYDYYDYLRERNLLPSLSLVRPSSWFLEQLERLKTERPILIHVRRGDYLQPKHSFIGVLSPEYYIKAIAQARQSLSNGGERKVWVFSDDPMSVKKELDPRLQGAFEFILPPEGADPAESLILMSKADAVVVSNSTFSWWGAMLGEEKVVVAPSKWFRDKEDPAGLIPEKWIRVPSIWHTTSILEK